MARRPPERPTFEPPVPAGPVVPPPPVPPASPDLPERPERDPLRAMAPVFVTLAAIGVTALAIWLPVREAQDEAIKHFPTTAYVDVPPGTTRTWHNVQWRMTTFRQVPWKAAAGLTTPPPRTFVRMDVRLHCRLLGPYAKLKGQAVDELLTGASLSSDSFAYELRDRDGRVWDPTTKFTDADWDAYKPATGMDVRFYADIPASEAAEITLVAKYVHPFNVTKTPSPRETVLRFVR